MDWLINILRVYPVIPIFLTIGLGFWLGNLKYKSFSLGPVAATLLVGVAFGQFSISIPDIVKNIFFALFLFAIGYSVGPQFFRSFKGQGLKQVIFAIIAALVSASTVIIAAKIMGYNKGIAAGLFAGSQTISASLGVVSETLKNLAIPEDQKEYFLEMIPACYAVTYVFGTIGSAWLLANIGPMLMGGLSSVKQETTEIEAEMDTGEFEAEPGAMVANRPVSIRAYKAEGSFFDEPKTVAEIEKLFFDKDLRIFVDRLRIRGAIREPSPKLRVRKGDSIVLSGRREAIVGKLAMIGPEVADHELLSFGVENLHVTVAKNDFENIGDLRRQPWMRGVLIRSLTRNGISLPIRSKTPIQRGDVMILVGLSHFVNRAVGKIGYSDKHTNITDVTFLGLGLALGCFVGILTVHIYNVPLSLSTSGGALLSGLALGWLRNRKPIFGRIPESVVWIFNNLGLNMFIAVVGITSGGAFIRGIKEVGLGLFLTGIVTTIVPLLINMFIARKLFKFSAPETLGCVAGARNGIASIGAIQDALDSDVPAIGYTVTYAVANLALVFSSLLVLFLC